MATTKKESRARLVAKVKYSDGGVIKNATRSLGPGGYIGYESAAEALDNQDLVENVISKYQAIITDTIVGFQIEMVDEFTGDFGSPGTNASVWDAYEDVKLINNYTDGDKTSKETVKRVATAANSDAYYDYVANISKMQKYEDGGEQKYAPVNGFLTGSTVDAAWQAV